MLVNGGPLTNWLYVAVCMHTSFTEELTSTTEQRTVHITPNKAEFLQTMMSCHNDDYEVLL